MYAKLSSTITRSSIWREPPATRVVWIALLALANKDGFVKGVEAWLASEANVSRDECRAALETFMAPDPESQDQDYGGRRLEKVEGGWLVLNYKKYREMRTQEQVLAAERQQRKRKRDKGLDDSGAADADEVTGCHAASRCVTTIASASETAFEEVGSARVRDGAEVSGDEIALADSAGTAPAGVRVAHVPTAAQPAAERGATVGLAAEFEDPAHREVYLDLRASHRLAKAFDATLRKLNQPITGGPAHSWAEIGAALLAQAGNGESFNELRLRGYLRTAREAPPSDRSASSVLRPDYSGGFVGQQPWQSAARARDGQPYLAAGFWDLCVTGGLAAGMQSRETLAERVQVLHRDGRVSDPAQFLALVLHVKPWALAEIRFRKERDERLSAALASFTAPAAQEVA